MTLERLGKLSNLPIVGLFFGIWYQRKLIKEMKDEDPFTYK
jgi:hypothetical protein